MPKCSHNSPEDNKCQPACTTAHGEEILRKYCSGNNCHVDTACHNSSNKVGSSHGNMTCTARSFSRFTGRLRSVARPDQTWGLVSAILFSLTGADEAFGAVAVRHHIAHRLLLMALRYLGFGHIQ